MAERNPNDDRTQIPKSRPRPRPEVQRPINPPPGGLPMPPSRQHSVPQPGAFPLTRQQNVTRTGSLPLPQAQQIAQRSADLNFPPSRPSVQPSSSTLRESGATIPRPGTSFIPSENPTASGTTMPIDMFGLPDFTFPIPSTSKSGGFGFSATGFSSIKSPTHLPKLANIKVPNLLGGHAARSGIGGSPSAIQLPGPPHAKSLRDQRTRNLPVMSASTASASKDLPKRAKRPTDLPLTNVNTTTNISSNPGPSGIPGTSGKFSDPKASKELHRSSHTTHATDRVPESNVPTCPIHGPSTAESNLDPRSLPGTSSTSLPSTSSISLPGPSSNTIPKPQDPQEKLDIKRSSDPTPVVLPGPSEIRRSGDSMPSIAQSQGAIPKTTSAFRKFKRFMRKGMSVKKTKGGPEEREESTGLVFERDDEGERDPRPQPRPKEPKEKYKNYPPEVYSSFWGKDYFLPTDELMEKCYATGNTKVESPTESEISDGSTEQDRNPVNPAAQTTEPISRSTSNAPSREPICTCHSASENLEQASTSNARLSESASTCNPAYGIFESPLTSSPIPGIFVSPLISSPTPGTPESLSRNNLKPGVSESASRKNPTPEVSESPSKDDPKAETPESIFKD